MEGSKAFAKTFMAKYGIPTARYETFNEYEEAKEYLENVSHDVVIKASGLAAGKGVILPISKAEAHAALKHLMLDKQFGSAGDEVVIEERLKGRELSFLSFSDGYTIRTLPPGQDHKKIFDSDCGPNTGGMGAYAPSPLATPQLIEEVHRTILQPTIDGMRAEKMPFKGLLFTGLMIVEDGRPMTLEYNVRFGDPETQTMLPLMDCDLAEVMVACTDTYLSHVNIKAHSLFSTTVVASAGGYPGPYVRGDEITITSPPPDTYIFHAGTNPPTAIEAEHDSAHSVPSQNPSTSLTTSGGRVIAATSTNRDLAKAISQAYDGISTIEFANMHYRKDIGKTGLELQTTQNRLDSSEKFTYASAGVSIASGNTFVKSIISLVASTARPGILPYLGGFGAVVDLAAAGYHPLSPRLVLGADGVGTKLKIAHAIGKHDTIGIDLVAMNVNDLVVQGAEPLAFLDVYSCGKLDPDVALEVVKGICAGCREACCVLPGGETAEMSGLFLNEDAYDVVGFAMGAIEQGRLVLPTKDRMNVGDILLGLESNGCHSNGFSLIRKIIECSGLKYSDRAPWNIEEFVGESLLLPTRIYVRPLLEVVRKDLVKGMAHITGGGLIENIPRMLPKHLAAEIDVTAWEIPKVLRWLKDQGRMEHQVNLPEITYVPPRALCSK